MIAWLFMLSAALAGGPSNGGLEPHSCAWKPGELPGECGKMDGGASPAGVPVAGAMDTGNQVLGRPRGSPLRQKIESPRTLLETNAGIQVAQAPRVPSTDEAKTAGEPNPDDLLELKRAKQEAAAAVSRARAEGHSRSEVASLMAVYRKLAEDLERMERKADPQSDEEKTRHREAQIELTDAMAEGREAKEARAVIEKWLAPFPDRLETLEKVSETVRNLDSTDPGQRRWRHDMLLDSVDQCQALDLALNYDIAIASAEAERLRRRAENLDQRSSPGQRPGMRSAVEARRLRQQAKTAEQGRSEAQSLLEKVSRISGVLNQELEHSSGANITDPTLGPAGVEAPKNTSEQTSHQGPAAKSSIPSGATDESTFPPGAAGTSSNLSAADDESTFPPGAAGTSSNLSGGAGQSSKLSGADDESTFPRGAAGTSSNLSGADDESSSNPDTSEAPSSSAGTKRSNTPSSQAQHAAPSSGAAHTEDPTPEQNP